MFCCTVCTQWYDLHVKARIVNLSRKKWKPFHINIFIVFSLGYLSQPYVHKQMDHMDKEDAVEIQKALFTPQDWV